MTDPRFVITGTGRSGSGYAARLFTNLGLSCGHERAFSLHQPANHDLPGDSSWIAAAQLPLLCPVFHQVRHPLAVVNSLCGQPGFIRGDTDHPDHDPWFSFMIRHCRELVPGDPPELNAMRWWYHWNKRIEPHADMGWRLEDLDAVTLIAATDKLGHNFTIEQAQKALDQTPQTVNQHERANLTWADLPDSDIKAVCEVRATDYGYEI